MLLDYHSANFKTFVCVERPSSTWARSAEEVENQIGLDRSVRPGLTDEAGNRIGMSQKAVGKIFP